MRSLQEILSEATTNIFGRVYSRLDEMASSIQEKGNDEHDIVDTINDIPRKHLKHIKSPEHFHAYVDKHTENPDHPFYGRDAHSIKRYGHVIHALLNHRPKPKGPSVRENLEAGGKLEVYGGSKKDNEHSDEWKAENGGSDKTPKTDIVSRDASGKTHATISLKEGKKPQFMSGESGNVRGVYGVAANRMTKDPAKRDKIKKTVKQITDIQEKSTSVTDENERGKMVKKMSDKLKKLHSDHPDLQKHVIHVASTGEGMFKPGSDAIARHVISYQRPHDLSKGSATVKDPAKGEIKGTIRASRGKGDRKAKNPKTGKVERVGKRQHVVRFDSE